MQCKNVVPTIFSQSMPTNVNQNFSGFPQMPFLPNPYYLYGNASMTSMQCGTPTVNNPFAYTFLKMLAKVIHSLKFLLRPKAKDMPLR